MGRRRVLTLVLAALLALTPIAHAAVEAGASTTSGTPGAGRATSITLTLPAGVVTGDLLLAHIGAEGASTLITPPAGWTVVARVEGAELASAIFSRTATASEPTSYNFDLGASTRVSGGMLRLQNAFAAGAIESVSHATGSGTTLAAPSVANAAPGALLVLFCAGAFQANWATPTGATEQWDRNARVSLQAATRAPAMGATGSTTCAPSSAGAMVAHHVLVRETIPPTIAFAQATSSAPENSGNVALTVALSKVWPANVTVNYAVTGGTATSGDDFTLASGTLTIPSGAASGVITLQVHGDTTHEPDETVIVTLSAPVGATLGAITTRTHTILNDDPILTQEIIVATDPVLWDGASDPEGSWGGWDAEAGQLLVPSRNYLKLTNAGTVPNPRIVVSFSGAHFAGTLDAAHVVPIGGNIEFTWWEDMTPGASAPNEGDYVWRDGGAGASVTIDFTGAGHIVYVAYRIKQMPAILVPQPYQASFTVTEL